MMRHPVLAAC
eukprot:gene26391-biopygen16250